MGPFTEWVDSINQIENKDLEKPELFVEKVHIQSVDMFGPRIGFVKFEVIAKKWNEKMKQIVVVPGIVFMRGGAVAVLCILIEPGIGGKEYALLTLQPRVPAGISDFPELPAGMLDGEPDKQKFAGKAAKEMNEEALLEIKDYELFDLTHMAYGHRYKGMYPSAGGCDEFLKLYLYRRYMNHETLQLLQKLDGGEDDNEIIKLKVVPLEDLWHEAPDAKALAALFLYHKFLEIKPEAPPITPLNAEQEEALVELLHRRDAEKERERKLDRERREKGKDKMEVK